MKQTNFLKDFDKLESASLKWLKNCYKSGEEVIVKIHFGERGNKTALFPRDVAPIISAMKKLGLKPILTDTPVVYNSPRRTANGYKRVVIERGYDKLAPFIIENKYIKVKAKSFTVDVAKTLAMAKNVLVISHVKGHALAGFGGAVKNLAMGGVSKFSKGKQHLYCRPKFVKDCRGCGTCAELCPAKAIEMVKGKAKVHKLKCWGCSICQIHCPYQCLAPWRATFDDLLGQAAAAVIKKLPKKTFYINIIKNITEGCDCEVDSGKIISPDIGILFSDDPIVIDRESIELINRKSKKNVFEVQSRKDPMLQIDYCEKYLE